MTRVATRRAMKRSSSLAVIGFLTPHFSRSALLHQRANAWPLSLRAPCCA
eukprot:CAMPEP_0181219018 /NCGR_PEP_ID=MMETSP1096-20121128/28020_1 /TAXON_ID=156174 ORGANISM="Chrysochromulina ericina, Strain CCMP281" /NCGR_SAMPLE_ID=MMETSP1096 /ASSEMBLY_ACC=CAM_ASM_000453 /LENGTH=49 /DNA_ID=CAMNT_0023311307 /DNA_START=375 /DNA_END=524 /DNA_ORIENTATION=-